MKKKILIILLVVVGLFVTGCTTKETLSGETFTGLMQNKGFTIQDTTSQFATLPSVEKCIIAQSMDQGYQIEFYVLDSEASAQTFYAQNKDKFASIGAGAHTEVSSGNFQKYTQISNGKYSVVSRISNTAIYVNADNIYQEQVKTLLKDIGY